MPATAHWRLVPKLRPEHVEDHERFERELCAVKEELAGIGIVARILSPKKSDRRRELLREKDLLERQIVASHMPVGADLGPPRIGIDEAATKWYRKYLAEDENAWPLPPDEMIEEMSGHPVWELCKPRVPFDLGLDWPSRPLQIPTLPAISGETQRAMARDLSPEEAVEVANRIRSDIFANLRSADPALAEASDEQVLQATHRKLQAQAVEAKALEPVLGALSAAMWLEFWGKNDYAFTTGETVT